MKSINSSMNDWQALENELFRAPKEVRELIARVLKETQAIEEAHAGDPDFIAAQWALWRLSLT